MDIYCNEGHEKLRQKVRDFAEQTIRPVARELDEQERFSVELTGQLGEMGLLGIQVPEKYGGQGLDTLSYIISVEEVSRIDGSQGSTLASHNSLGIVPILKYGTAEQVEKYIPSLCTGKGLWAFGLTEPEAGSNIRGGHTKAEKANGQWTINGSKTFITNGNTPITLGASVHLYSGIKENGKKEFSILLVERDTPGFTAESIKGKMMWRASNTASLFFDNCKVHEKNLVGELGQGPRIIADTLNGGRLSIAAMGLGLAQGAYELALKYAKKRKQFGEAISNFQAIQFKLADMDMKIELARNMLYKACWLKDKGADFEKAAAMAKLYCSEVANEVAYESLQIHGGAGLIKDHEIERHYRDQRILQIGEGTSEIQRLIIARHILKKSE